MIAQCSAAYKYEIFIAMAGVVTLEAQAPLAFMRVVLSESELGRQRLSCGGYASAVRSFCKLTFITQRRWGVVHF